MTEALKSAHKVDQCALLKRIVTTLLKDYGSSTASRNASYSESMKPDETQGARVGEPREDSRSSPKTNGKITQYQNARLESSSLSELSTSSRKRKCNESFGTEWRPSHSATWSESIATFPGDCRDCCKYSKSQLVVQ